MSPPTLPRRDETFGQLRAQRSSLSQHAKQTKHEKQACEATWSAAFISWHVANKTKQEKQAREARASAYFSQDARASDVASRVSQPKVDHLRVEVGARCCSAAINASCAQGRWPKGRTGGLCDATGALPPRARASEGDSAIAIARRAASRQSRHRQAQFVSG